MCLCVLIITFPRLPATSSEFRERNSSDIFLRFAGGLGMLRWSTSRCLLLQIQLQPTFLWRNTSFTDSNKTIRNSILKTSKSNRNSPASRYIKHFFGQQRCECFEIGCEWRWSSPIFHTSWWHRYGWCSLFGLGADDDIGEDLSWLFGLSAERRCHQGQQIGEWHLWSRWMFKFGIGTWYLGLQHRDERWRFVCCLDVDDDFVRKS